MEEALSEQAVLEGVVSVEAALRSGSRTVERICIHHRKRDRTGTLYRLERQAQAAGVPVERVAQDDIATLATGKTHGGVVAVVGPRRYVQLADLATSSDCPFVVMLDGVEDPFNFGAAVRALYAAGADGLVVRPRNWMSAAAIVARSSAGASELIPTAVADTAMAAGIFFRDRGLSVACSTKDRAASIYDQDLTLPLFVVIGGEKRGITRSFVDQADLRLRIPYQRDFRRSLGTAAAVAVLAFEIMRQRASG
jgi:23S rRNA (guanosine2251-2'-O)-methyltransferase